MNNTNWKIGDLPEKEKQYLRLMDCSIAVQNSFNYELLNQSQSLEDEHVVPFQSHLKLLINSGKLDSALENMETRIGMARAAYNDGRSDDIIKILNGRARYEHAGMAMAI